MDERSFVKNFRNPAGLQIYSSCATYKMHSKDAKS